MGEETCIFSCAVRKLVLFFHLAPHFCGVVLSETEEWQRNIKRAIELNCQYVYDVKIKLYLLLAPWKTLAVVNEPLSKNALAGVSWMSPPQSEHQRKLKRG